MDTKIPKTRTISSKVEKNQKENTEIRKKKTKVKRRLLFEKIPVSPKRDCWVASTQLLKSWVVKEDGYRNMTKIHTKNITHIADFRIHFAMDTIADDFPVAGYCSWVAGRSGWWGECSLSMELTSDGTIG